MSIPSLPSLAEPLRLSYRIDSKDRLCAVNEAWRTFALENDGSVALADGAIGTELWDHIDGLSVREIYRRLTARARAGRVVRFCYRCDSPVERRTFEMTIRAEANGQVLFLTELIFSEQRASVRLLENTSKRTEELVRVCAWCQRVALEQTEWAEVEDAVNRLDLLRAERLPRLTHTICERCRESFSQVLSS